MDYSQKVEESKKQFEQKVYQAEEDSPDYGMDLSDSVEEKNNDVDIIKQKTEWYEVELSHANQLKAATFLFNNRLVPKCFENPESVLLGIQLAFSYGFKAFET